MKIWCLQCGTILDKVTKCKPKTVECPCCGEKLTYTADGEAAYIAMHSTSLDLINKEICIMDITHAR